MANVTLLQTYSFRDAKGFIGRTRYFITGDDASGTFSDDVQTVLDTLGPAVIAMTNAALSSANGPQIVTRQSLSYGANSEYPAEFMKAIFTFTTDSASISRFSIPAPKLAIFDTDGVTVLNDGTQALVVAYVAAVKTAVNTVFVSTLSGLPFTHFVGGKFKGGRQTFRHNQFIKSSHLVAGEGE